MEDDTKKDETRKKNLAGCSFIVAVFVLIGMWLGWQYAITALCILIVVNTILILKEKKK